MENRLFQVLGFDHIGVVPNQNDGLFTLLNDFLDFSYSEKEEILDQKTVVQKLSPKKNEESIAIELLEPLNAEGVIQKYRERNKSGLHHIAIRVKGICELISFLESKKVEMIDREPRIGHNGCRVAFIHPRSTSGILCELVERDS